MSGPSLHKRRDVPVFVYAIQPEGMDRVKVGVTDNLERRAAQLASFSPVPLIWRRVVQVYGRGAGFVWERHVLAWASDGHGFGEWRDDLAAVDDLMGEIVPAVDVTDSAPAIKAPRRTTGYRLTPQQVDERLEYVEFLDGFGGWVWEAHRAAGLRETPPLGPIPQDMLDRIRAFRRKAAA